jgi:photosystem II stability/assembly factor-like uncharacterized protein
VTRALPRPGGFQLSAAGPGSLWLVSYAANEGPSLYGTLYRSTDGARTWTRIARENGLVVYAVTGRRAYSASVTCGAPGPGMTLLMVTEAAGVACW